MNGQAPILLSVALLALLGSLPRLLEKEETGESECPVGGRLWDGVERGRAGVGGGQAPCVLPFLSHNPLTLRCPGAAKAEEEAGGLVHWQYLNLSLQASLQPPAPGIPPSLARPRTFIGPRGVRAQRGPLTELSSRALVQGGVLLLSQARTSDSGLYLCKSGGPVGGGRTLASYRVDVQDAGLLYVTHQGLGQAPLRNQTVRLGPGGPGVKGQLPRPTLLLLHTRWGPWQDCDRCGTMGERKRVGFCYAARASEEEEEEEEVGLEGEGEGRTPQLTAAEAAQAWPELPCGLMQLRLGQALPRRGPELRYETCRRDCGAMSKAQDLAQQAQELLGQGRQIGRGSGNWLEPQTLLLETLLLDLGSDARLACPGASVYTPVSWQRDTTMLTRLELLRRCNSTHWLEEATGGAAYHIAGLRRSDQGVYRCWVSGRRAAAFHLELPELPTQRQLRSQHLLNILRLMVAGFALVFVISALAELLHACWCERL